MVMMSLLPEASSLLRSAMTQSFSKQEESKRVSSLRAHVRQPYFKPRLNDDIWPSPPMRLRREITLRAWHKLQIE